MRLAALLLVTVLAGTLHAQERLDRTYEKGELISREGGHKQVYAVKGHPELVLLVLEPGRPPGLLAREKALLDELAEKGIPAARFLAIGTYEGHDAAIQRRFEVSTKDQRFSDFDVQLSVLSEKTIEDAKKIAKALATHPEIAFVDFQLLVGKDGSLAVNDPFPAELVPPKPPGWDPIAELGFDDAELEPAVQLDILIHQAKQVVSVKKTLARLKTMKGADDPELAELFSRREVGLPGVPSFDEERVKKALLKYLETEPTTDEARAIAKTVREGKIALRHKWTWQSEKLPDELRISPINYFPVLASELVYEGAKFLAKGIVALEREVLAEAHRLRFLSVKGAPDGMDRDEIHKNASSLAKDPEGLVETVERTRKLAAGNRSELAAKARTILRGPSRTSGLSGLLDERLGEADVHER